MEAMLLLAILLFLGPLVVSIIVAVRFAQLRSSVDDLKRRVIQLETQRADRGGQPAPAKSAIPPPLPAFLKPPPPIPEPAGRGMGFQPVSHRRDADATVVPSSVNWESILGVKFFAWIGGLALFLGVVFFVRYAFENNLITPGMRVIAGAIIGLGLVIAGGLPALQRYRVPAQSLCATGILILYADAYAAHSFYDLIPLSAATALMWILTAITFILATRLDTQSAAWLGVLGGFLTPILFRTQYDNPAVLFGYIGVLNCGVAAVSVLKRWNYLIVLTAIGSVITEFTWAADFFGPADANAARIVFLATQALFLVLCIVPASAKSDGDWNIAGAAIAGFASLLFCLYSIHFSGKDWAFAFPMLLLGDAGLVALAVIYRSSAEKAKALSAIIGTALAFTWLAEWSWHGRVFLGRGFSDAPLIVEPRTNFLVAWHVAIFLLFATTPYFCGTRRLWPWMIAAIAGPLQFWFVHWLLEPRFPHDWLWLLPIAFALPAAIGVLYLVKSERVDLASGDSRLATQGAAVLAFVSLVFPVQFQHEWIALGWALEGVVLILLFRWIPNRRLRAVALIVLCAAFARLTLNPGVFEYHPRSRTPIWNWYLYAYGTAAVCFFLSAHWFGDPRERWYERNGSRILYALVGIVCFLLMNIEIADYFSIGPTLTFSFSGNFARDMTYTIAWALFAFLLLMIGMVRDIWAVRLAAVALLLLALAKLFLHDLDSLSQLYRIAAFITVAIIAIVASFIYQRFLSPGPKKT